MNCPPQGNLNLYGVADEKNALTHLTIPPIDLLKKAAKTNRQIHQLRDKTLYGKERSEKKRERAGPKVPKRGKAEKKVRKMTGKQSEVEYLNDELGYVDQELQEKRRKLEEFSKRSAVSKGGSQNST